MKKGFVQMLTMFLTATVLFSACGTQPGKPDDTTTENNEPVTLTLADISTSGSFANKEVLHYADKVKELSDGNLEIKVFSDSLLGKETAAGANIQSGALDMAVFYSTFASMVPKAGVFDLPFFISEREQIQNLFDEGVMDEIYAQAEEINIKVVCLAENGFRHITNNKKPVVVPEDLSGMVIRTPNNKLRVAMFEAMGASAEPLAWSEVYQALESGVCDGQENPFSQIGGAQLYNVQKYLSLSGHIYTPIYICINLDLYNSLTKEQQDILMQAGVETMHYAWEAGKTYDEEQLENCRNNGMEINEVDTNAFREILLPLWDQFSKDAGGSDFVKKSKDALGY